MRKNTFLETMKIFFCGLAMGAADVVPGVSGGTIAFITGIYSRLLDAIKSVDLQFFKLFFTGKFKAAFSKIPFAFIIPLLLGILTAIFTLAHIILYFLQYKPLFIWPFFLGLIIACSYLLFKELAHKNIFIFIVFLLGLAFALAITNLGIMRLPNSLFYVFVAGAIAICAMLLPGISGSFLLVILGKYDTVLSAVTNFDMPVLLSFASGAVCGILLFARLLSYLLKHYHSITIAFLTGVMCGSIRHIYLQIPSLETPYFLITALLCIVLGVCIPLSLNYISKKLR